MESDMVTAVGCCVAKVCVLCLITTNGSLAAPSLTVDKMRIRCAVGAPNTTLYYNTIQYNTIHAQNTSRYAIYYLYMDTRIHYTLNCLASGPYQGKTLPLLPLLGVC